MKCSKCGHNNDVQANFCSSCGMDFKQAKVPAWIWGVLLFFAVAISGIGYGVWELYGRTQTAAPLQSNVAADVAQVPEPVAEVAPVATIETKQAEEKTLDRVALIKDVQQKVFTVVTSYGRGSGFLYEKGGYVITNAHVVDGEIDVLVQNFEGQEFEATVIGISESFDIALLYVPSYRDMEPLPTEPKQSPIGLEVIAFGSPQGFNNTASPGYLTGHNRDMEVDRFIYKQIYQIDAQIDKGSSGGPLVDAQTGKVIGINSLLYTSDTSTTFGFSIPLYSMTSYFDEWIKAPMSRENILAAAGYYDDYYYDDDSSYDYDYYEESNRLLAGQFVQAFRMYYEQALNDSNFYWVADMLIGEAYEELEDYVADISYQGHTFHFLTNNILDVTYDSGVYYVYMNETFDFYSAAGDHEYFDRYKTYTVIVDEYDAFKIAHIDIHK